MIVTSRTFVLYECVHDYGWGWGGLDDGNDNNVYVKYHKTL